VVVEDQIFAEITEFNEFQMCASEEGVLGLGFSDQSSHFFPSVLSHLKDTLVHPIFSLYFHDTDDYPDNDEGPNANMTALSANSEIVFGAVNQERYDGCLSWHDVDTTSQTPVDNTDYGGLDTDTFSQFWNFKLDQVSVGGTQVEGVDMAIIDSGTPFIIGPPAAISVLAEVEGVYCLDLGAGIPIEVNCTNEDGFDAAVIDCDKPLFNVDFEANGETYSLQKDDLIVEVDSLTDEEGDTMCLLRILGTFDVDGWILGAVFLNRHYSVFDFVNNKIGFARLSKDSAGTTCNNDMPLDISTMDAGNPSPGPPPPPPPQPVAAPTKAPLVPTATGTLDTVITPKPQQPPPPPGPPQLPPDDNLDTPWTNGEKSDTPKSKSNPSPIPGLTPQELFGVVIGILVVSILGLLLMSRRRHGGSRRSGGRYSRATANQGLSDYETELELTGGVLS